MEETPSWLNRVFGEHLRKVRKEARLSQEELGFRTGLDRTYISLLERGIKSPTLVTFFRLCDALEQKPGDFIAYVYEQLLRREQEHQPYDREEE